MNRLIKILLFIFLLFVALTAFTIFNYVRLSYNATEKSDSYLTELINKNDIENINYNYIYNDLKRIDNEIKIRNIKNNDYNELINYYYYAGEIYNNKINELSFVLNNLLDNQDFKSYLNDLEDFNISLQNETNDIERDYNNEQLVNLYKYKNIYEKRHEKCYSILENYKGFLK